MLLGRAISFLVIVRLVTAASYNCSALFIEVSTSADATSLARECSYYPGLYIDIGPDYSSKNAAFDGLQVCAALGITDTPYLTAVSSDSFSATGSLSFLTLPALQSVRFPNFTQVLFAPYFSQLALDGVPLLTEFELGPGLHLPDTVFILSTGLKSFNNSLPFASNSLDEQIVISQNKNMGYVHLGLESFNPARTPCSGCVFNISYNAQGATIDLPNLRYVNLNTFLGDFATLSIPRLQTVNASLHISNAQVSRFSAPELQTVAGNLSIIGNFTEFDLPALSAVKGDVYVRGATGLNCSLFKQVSINGALDCTGIAVPLSTSVATSSASNAISHTSSHSSATLRTSSSTRSGTSNASATSHLSSTPSTASATSISSSTSTASATSTGLSTAAKGGIGGGVAAAALLIIVLAVWYFWRKWGATSTFPDIDPEHEKTHGKLTAAELPLGRHHEKPELEASPNHVSELTGDHRYRPRPPIESMPITAPSSTQVVEGDSEQNGNARLSGPAELEWPRDGDFRASSAS